MDFQKVVADELARLNKVHADLLSEREGIDKKLSDVEREMKAVQTYHDIKSGKTQTKKTRAPKEGGVRQGVLNMIASSGGSTRSQLLDLMQAKGNKKLETQISNALTSLKKDGKLVSTDGKYTKA